MTTDVHPIAIRETLPAPLDRLSIHISPTANPAKIRETLEICCRGIVNVERADRALKFLIGKQCLIIKARKLFREYGYQSFEAFLQAEVVRPGLKRQSVMTGIRACKTWPEASADLLAGLPHQNLTLAAGIAKRGHLTGTRAEQLLEEARKLSPEELAARHDVRCGHGSFAVIRVVTSKSFQREFERWLGDQDAEQILRDLVHNKAVRRSVTPQPHHKAA